MVNMKTINLDSLYRQKVREASELQACGQVRLVTMNAKTLAVWCDGDLYWSADEEMQARHPTTADIT